MAYINLSHAARLVPVSRSTLNRHVKNGKITKHKNKFGKPVVETSELLRVYGELKDDTQSDSVKSVPMTQPDISQKEADFIRLQVELEAARKEIDRLNDDLGEWKVEARDWKQQAQTSALAPPAESSREAENSSTDGGSYKLGWFDKLMGRKPLSGS